MTDVDTSPTTEPPADDHDTDAGSARRRRWPWIVAAAATALVVVLVVVAGGGDDDGSASPTDTTPVPDEVTPNLDDAGSELADLLAEGRGQTVHAVYRTSGGDDVTLELWRKDGRLRQDTHVEADGSTADTSGFLLDAGESITCSRRDDADWTCSSAIAETSEDGIFGSVLEQLAGVDVTARDDTIDGRSVRCFSFAAQDGEGEVCVTEDGVPVRAAVGDTAIELVEIDDVVDDDVFEPPADPSSAE